jgi:apolipoprotein N-acyltransferase
MAVLAWRLRGLGTGWRVLAGLAFGTGLYGLTIFWVTEFHVAGWVGLVVLQALFYAAAAGLTPPGPGVPFALPAAVVLTEAVHDVWPVGGIPIGGITLGQAGGPLVGIARLGGPLLLASAVTCMACGIAAVAARGDRRRAGLAAVAVVAAVAGLGAVAPDGSARGESLDAGIVQGGGRRGYRAVESDPGDVFGAHVATSRNLPNGLDLVLWPENAIDVGAIEGTMQQRILAAIATSADATLVAGVTEEVGTDNFHNVAVAWASDGEIVDRYVKVKRVPFGEYAPYRWLFGNLADLSVLPRDAVAGRGPGVLDTPAGKLGVCVSFEVFFAERARAAALAGAGVLLVPTNAASFSTSQVPAEEVAAARLRAVETGRWLLQAAPTGYSAVVDHRGHLHARSVLGERQILTATVPLRSGTTPYAWWGDAPTLALAFIVLAFAWSPAALVTRVRTRWSRET